MNIYIKTKIYTFANASKYITYMGCCPLDEQTNKASQDSKFKFYRNHIIYTEFLNPTNEAIRNGGETS